MHQEGQHICVGFLFMSRVLLTYRLFVTNLAMTTTSASDSTSCIPAKSSVVFPFVSSQQRFPE